MEKKMNDLERAKEIGALLKNFPQRHEKEYSQGLTLDENTILQKIVSEEVLTAKIKIEEDGKSRTHSGVRVESQDYLKALVFLDFYSRVLDNSISACEKSIELAVKLRELKDKEGGNIFDLNLGTIVYETGLVAQQRSSENPETFELGKIALRYDQDNVFVSNQPSRKIEPYYRAVGLRIVEMVPPDYRGYFDGINNRSDLEAFIFTSCVIGVLEDEQAIKLIEQEMLKNKLNASIKALYALRNEASLDRLKKAIKGGYK